MATKKNPVPKYKCVDPTDYDPPDEKHYRLFTCVLNTGGGIRRPFYAEFVRDLCDPPGPMARFVMRVTERARNFRGGDANDIQPYELVPGDYVVYSQEIVAEDYIEL